MDNPAETPPGIPDIRHVSLTQLTEQKPKAVTDVLRRILPDRTAAALPVCAFQSSI